MEVDFNKHLLAPLGTAQQASRQALERQLPAVLLSLARAGLKRPRYPVLCLQPQAAPFYK